MNVTDEMVQAALDAQPFTESNSSLRVWQLIDCDGERTDKLMRAALEAALSHAAGQEVDYSARFRHAGEWSRYPEGTRAHDINGGYWQKIGRRWKWMPDGGAFPRPGADAFDVSIPAVARSEGD